MEAFTASKFDCAADVDDRDDFANGLALLAQPQNAFRDRLHLRANPLHARDGFVDGAPAVLRDLGGSLRAISN